MRAGGLVVGCLLVVGCAPERCVPGDYTREWACPSEEMVDQQIIITDAFETFFGELGSNANECIWNYSYREAASTEEIDDICNMSDVWGCTKHRRRESQIAIYAYPFDERRWEIQRHEALHLILQCKGDDRGHDHPAFVGKLPQDPTGVLLVREYDGNVP